MGRHTAEITIPSPEEIAADRARRILPASTPRFSERTPVTDPNIFDAPLPTTAPRTATASLDPGSAPTPTAVLSGPAPTAVLPAPARPLPPRPAAPQPRAAADTQALRDLRTIAPRPVAVQVPPRSAHEPAARPAPVRTGGPVAPPAGRQRVAGDRTAVLPAPAAPGTRRAARREPAEAFRSKRSLSLAVCAMAVLGAVSGAAVMLPDEGAVGTPGGLGKHGSGSAPAGATPAAATTAAAKAAANAHGKAMSAAAHQRAALRRAARHAARTPAPVATSVGPTVTPLGQLATPSPSLAPTTSATAVATRTPAPTGTATARSTSSPSRTSTPRHSATPSSSTRPTPGAVHTSSPAPTGTSSLRSAVSAVANGAVVALGAGIHTFDDFTSSMIGVDLSGKGGIDGAGVDRTIVQMRAGTSSKAGSVPHTDWKTNPLYLLRFGGSPVLKDFTLRATAQGHLYNGMKLRGTTDARVTNVRVEGVPGNDDIPPGETFGINDANTHGSVYDHVEVDGNHIGSSGFATNSSTDVTVRNSDFTDSAYGNGATFWQTRNVSISNTRSVNNKDFAFNFERVSGTVRITDAVMTGNKQGDLRFASDQGSAKVTIVDPKFSGSKLRIKVNSRYLGTTNKQRVSDIHVIINGVDKTDSVVEWIR